MAGSLRATFDRLDRRYLRPGTGRWVRLRERLMRPVVSVAELVARSRVGLRRYALMPKRFGTAIRYYRTPLERMISWTWSSREVGNFTYDLSATNRRHLAAFVSISTGVPVDEVKRYFAEVDSDHALRAHVRSTLALAGKAAADDPVHFGRRLGWYALVRATKPRVVIETGIDRGLGACLLCSALLRNAAEGAAGRYTGTDIDPGSGILFTPPYTSVGTLLRGDSIESLRTLIAAGTTIDLFINDSDHSADYERREYETIREALAPGSYIIGDNAHVTNELMDFAQATGRAFLFFHERPADHWYPGAGIGLAFRPDDVSAGRTT